MKKYLSLFGLALILAAPSVQALRCGHRLVHRGDHAIQVLKKCGEPTYEDHRVEYRVVRLQNPALALERLEPVNVDEWTYDFGSNRFMRVLLFENGRLVDIQSLGYGSD